MNFPVLPDQASTFAEQVDYIALTITALTVFFTVLIFGLLLYLSVRYRKGSKVNRQSSGSHNYWLEIAWSVPPLFLGLGIFAWSVKPYAEVFNPPPDAEEIFVIGKRWMWHLQHSVNGIRENNELHVPMGRPFKLTIISQDVIHGFSIPDFRMKRDAMPGQYNTVWFEATKPGKHHLFCTEYCGTDHSQMGGWVYVMTPADYDVWVNSKGMSSQPPSTPEQSGFDLFNQLACANCHKNEDSLRAPTLNNLIGRRRSLQNGTVVVADDSYLRKAIRNPEENVLQGYAPTMPSYKDSLDEQQIHDLIMYIKSLGNGARKPGAGTGEGRPPTATPKATGSAAATRGAGVPSVAPAGAASISPNAPSRNERSAAPGLTGEGSNTR